MPSACLTVPKGQEGLAVVVGVEQVPEAVKYVPGGQGLGVVGVSMLTQYPPGCLTVPTGQGCFGVDGVEQIPEDVK